jgi:hypothetical protein
MFNDLLIPKSTHQLDHLIGALSPVREVLPYDLKLCTHPTHTDSQYYSASRHPIQSHKRPGDSDRMTEGQDEDPRSETNPTGSGGYRAEHDPRVKGRQARIHRREPVRRIKILCRHFRRENQVFWYPQGIEAIRFRDCSNFGVVPC